MPPKRPYDQSGSREPIISPVPHTSLCPACLNSLAHSLFVSPVRRSPYLREQSVRAFLSLVDDATASLATGYPLERISHHDLDFILRAELAVIEWRLAIKLARLNQRIAFFDTFQVELGEYSRLQPSKLPIPGKQSLITRAKNKIWDSIGMSGMSAISGSVPE